MSSGSKIKTSTNEIILSSGLVERKPRLNCIGIYNHYQIILVKYKTNLNNYLHVPFDLCLKNCQSFTYSMSIKYNYFTIKSNQSGLMSVLALYSSWLAMSNICCSPQSGWMPGGIMYQGCTAGGGYFALPLLVSGPVTCCKTIHEKARKCTLLIVHTAGCCFPKRP